MDADALYFFVCFSVCALSADPFGFGKPGSGTGNHVDKHRGGLLSDHEVQRFNELRHFSREDMRRHSLPRLDANAQARFALYLQGRNRCTSEVRPFR